MSFEEFLLKSRSVHGDKYEYDRKSYRKLTDRVEIICPEHGSFSRLAFQHINGADCNVCRGNSSKKELEWLESFKTINLLFQYRIGQIKKREALETSYEKKVAQIEMNALRSQMNPHFIFNSLNSIKNYALTKGPYETADYLTKFAHLVRLILQNSKKHKVEISDEVEAIREYIDIESMRFSDSFESHFEIDPDLLHSDMEIPPMIIQPYVENAIWHGLLHKEGLKKIEIIVKTKDTNNLQIEIVDNGIGREAAAKLRSKSHGKSFGMQLGANRIKLMSNNDGLHGTVEVIDVKDKNEINLGTKINITLPILDATKPSSTK